MSETNAVNERVAKLEQALESAKENIEGLESTLVHVSKDITKQVGEISSRVETINENVRQELRESTRSNLPQMAGWATVLIAVIAGFVTMTLNPIDARITEQEKDTFREIARLEAMLEMQARFSEQVTDLKLTGMDSQLSRTEAADARVLELLNEMQRRISKLEGRNDGATK